MTPEENENPTPAPGPRRSWREREKASRSRAAFLDTAIAPLDGSDVYTTAYEPDVLLVLPAFGHESPSLSTPDLSGLAKKFGWIVTPEPLEDPVRQPEPGEDAEASPVPGRRKGVSDTVRARISIAPNVAPDVPVQRPDAWLLLREARRAGIKGVSLNHVLTLDSMGANPFKGYPFKGYPFKGYPFKGYAGGLESYAHPGFGGRQPISYAGPDLPDAKLPLADRPIVAVLDTGLGDHPWLRGDNVVDPVKTWGDPLGVVDPDSDPERNPSLGDPLDGVIDDAAGHGTFIAGLIRQACPEARILPVRVSDGNGVIMENDLLGALGRIVDLIESGERIDILNLSLGFYHESPQRQKVEGELYKLLARARAKDCVVICSAGNDATDRPSSPAALYAWPHNDFGITAAEEKDLAPHVSVGALNPSRRSVALFSNVGPWVSTYARGVSVVSTVPVFQGGMQSDLRRDEYARRRETLDIDDFASGFAVWSGTSFSAPLVAGRVAASIAEGRKTKIAGPATALLTTAVAEIIKSLASEDGSTDA
ncbi:S8/S53 family peptidase [Microbacterium lacus]|uniref:S8 family peptidase n=1 Tax=Microbacterium lacus TaxID=415217 RepID=UPI00384E1C5A